MTDDTARRLRIGVPRESFPDEKRVALVPDIIPQIEKAGFDVCIETEAGLAAGFVDDAFVKKGAKIYPTRRELFEECDIVLQVRAFPANPEAGRSDLELMRRGQIIIGHFEPLSEASLVQEMAGRGVITFGIELLPRITRAQSMDALSAMATVGGYKAVLLAAEQLPMMFPMLMTAAGTISPARVLVVGAGVAGLQAIATAKRLGAVVRAYDVRPAVKEQVESLGAKFVEMDLGAEDAEDTGGYARAMDEEFYRKQRELMAKIVAESHVVVTTAAVPGKKAPVLISEKMIEGMPPGSVIVDLAAERGGNCEVTKAGDTVHCHGVAVLGPINLPSSVPYHASQMYARNLFAFLKNMVKDGEFGIDTDDEIVRDTLLTRDGELVNERLQEILQRGAEGERSAN
jgi:NAD(P) transhydrogenase subunit alpha